MNVESKKSYIAEIKAVSKVQGMAFSLTKKEYDELMQELWNVDEFLKEKYETHTAVPRIYSLFGVKIDIKAAY